MTRVLWSALGLVLVGLGILGAFLPLLPTVVFLLAGAFCFARGSQRLHGWLVNHPHFGPPIEDWRRYGAIRRPAKWMAMVAILLSFVLAFALGFSATVLTLQAAVLGAVSLFILTRPEGGAGPPE
ncbi:MAG: YbaN family protein [Paracoccaceae bacterium]|nr:YbaN family protein [Paracoccaceae bacterium]